MNKLLVLSSDDVPVGNELAPELALGLVSDSRQAMEMMMAAILLAMCLSGVSLAQEVSDAAAILPVGKVEEVKAGFTFTEGPAWSQDGSLFFTDIPNAKIHQLFEHRNTVGTFTSESGHANGVLVDASGRMLVCQMDGRVVQYDTKTAQYRILADKYEGKRFNAPNDLIVDKSGGIYFTDPLFRAPQPLPKRPCFGPVNRPACWREGLHCSPTWSDIRRPRDDRDPPNPTSCEFGNNIHNYFKSILLESII